MHAGQRHGLGIALLVGVCVGLVSLPALAADYYVNDSSTVGDVALPGCPAMSTGFDFASCGSCARPCGSPQYLYDSVALQPGDTVHLNTGAYGFGLSFGMGPILSLNDATKAGTPERWLTFTGPVDDAGRGLRDANGRLLAQIDGRRVATVGAVVGVVGIRLQAIGFAGFRDGAPLCGTGVRVATPGTRTSFSLVDLTFEQIAGACASAIDVDTASAACERCEIMDNEMSNSPSAIAAAIWVYGAHGTEIARNTIHGWGRFNDDGAISVQGGEKVHVHHNVVRHNQGPALLLRDARGTLVENNTFRFNVQGEPTANGFPAEIVAFRGSDHLVRSNIVSPREERGALAFSGTPPNANHNGYVASAGGFLVMDLDSGTRTDSLEAWQGFSGQDKDSLVVEDPRFVSDTDLHLRSIAGRWSEGGTWVADQDTSPFIDRGDPTADASLEPFPNGGRLNLGAFGNTPFASMTPLRLRMVSGDGQLGPVGETYPEALVVQASVEALESAAMQDLPLVYEVVQGQASIETLPQVTDSQGRSHVRVTPTGPGTVILQVRVDGAPSITPVRFTLQARPDYLVASGCTQVGALAPWCGLLVPGILVARRRRNRPA